MDLQKVRNKLVKQDLQREGRSTNQRDLIIEGEMRYLGIDITFEDGEGEEGIRSNQGLQCISYVRHLCLECGDLKSVVMVVKKLLHNFGLNSAYHGGLSSYTLVLMAHAFLKY